MNERRFDIDWLRVIAIGLLLIYHVAIAFQPWGVMIGFPVNKESWQGLWVPMTMLNVWRIPLLFFVSGMGVYFALQRRTWTQLIGERAGRILVPFIFGAIAIVPIHLLLWRKYYNMAMIYQPDQGHLWFLGNIFIYVLILSPLFYYFKHNEDGRVVYWIRKVMGNPLGLAIVAGCFILEAMILKPNPYEMYAKTLHGFSLGLLAFLFGFCFVLSGDGFLKLITKNRWVFVVIAVCLFVLRLQMKTPYYLLVLESQCWIYSVLAFGARYLNRGGKALAYLSSAAYPVYILHMVFLYLGALFIFPLSFSPELKFFLVLAVTFAGCFGTYEVIRRLKFIRPLFGLKFNSPSVVYSRASNPVTPTSGYSPGSSSPRGSSGNLPSGVL